VEHPFCEPVTAQLGSIVEGRISSPGAGMRSLRATTSTPGPTGRVLRLASSRVSGILLGSTDFGDSGLTKSRGRRCQFTTGIKRFRMATTIPPTGTITFQISTLPATPSAKKTVMRLMRMNPRAQRMLSKLSRNRVNNLNKRNPRAGRMWLSRATATRLVRVAVGEKFTLTMTPQIVNDVKSVESFLTRI